MPPPSGWRASEADRQAVAGSLRWLSESDPDSLTPEDNHKATVIVVVQLLALKRISGTSPDIDFAIAHTGGQVTCPDAALESPDDWAAQMDDQEVWATLLALVPKGRADDYISMREDGNNHDSAVVLLRYAGTRPLWPALASSQPWDTPTSL